MSRNVEVKAVIRNWEDIDRKAKLLSESEGSLIKQRDTFFKVSDGRFKLRYFEDGSGELIYYKRLDSEGPKLSSYKKTSLDKEAAQGVGEVLAIANGILGEVRKTRLLYIVGQTRIHIDKVNELGEFVELEVVLEENQSAEEGEKIAEDLMKKLGIGKDDLIPVAYLDLLLAL